MIGTYTTYDHTHVLGGEGGGLGGHGGGDGGGAAWQAGESAAAGEDWPIIRVSVQRALPAANIYKGIGIYAQAR